MNTLRITTINKTSPSIYQLILNNPLMQRWSLFGFMGTFLTGFSIPLEGDSGIVTAVSGVSVVVFSLYQKWQDERRKRDKHELIMRILEQHVKGNQNTDVEVLINRVTT